MLCQWGLCEAIILNRNRNAPVFDDEPTPAGAAHMKKSGKLFPNERRKSNKDVTLYQEVIQCIIQRYIYDTQRQNEMAGGTTDDIKHHFERMRYEVLTQYKVKDESIAMAMTVVHSIADHLKSVNADVELPALSWSNNGSADSQESFVYSILKSDPSLYSYVENYRDILCDVHEEPDDVENNEDEDEEEGGYEEEGGDEQGGGDEGEAYPAENSSQSPQQDAAALEECVIEVNDVEEGKNRLENDNT